MITVDEALSFLSNTFFYCFIMCLLGSLIKDLMDKFNNSSKLNIGKIIVSTVFSSFLSSALARSLNDRFGMAGMLFVCLLIGMFGYWILEWLSKYKNAYKLISNVLKRTGELGEGISEAMNDTEKDNVKDHKETKLKSSKSKPKKETNKSKTTKNKINNKSNKDDVESDNIEDTIIENDEITD